MLRAGSGEPLVLLHGIMGTEFMWESVSALLSDEYDVIALTALGHVGGPPAPPRTITFAEMTDAAEAQLDELGIERAHIAGNSMGGWMALELASRGRALSVCALSPAGMWDSIGGMHRDRLLLGLRMAGASRPFLPLAYRIAPVRQFALRHVARNGGAVSRQEAMRLTTDMLGCEVARELLETTEQYSLEELPCPVVVAWSEFDEIFPEARFGPVARERVPNAEYRVLPGVGHVPMLDDPKLVADTIRDAATA